MCAYLAIRPEGKTPTPPEPAEVDIETTIVALGAVGGTQFTAAEKSSLRRRIVAAGRPRLERRQARSARLRGSTPRAGLGRPGPCRVALQPGRGLGTRWQEVFIGDRRPGTDNQGETYQEGRKEGRKERCLSLCGFIRVAFLFSRVRQPPGGCQEAPGANRKDGVDVVTGITGIDAHRPHG